MLPEPMNPAAAATADLEQRSADWDDLVAAMFEALLPPPEPAPMADPAEARD